MKESLQNSIVGIAGMKGHGKSTWLRQNFEHAPALALIDTLGEHREWCPLSPAEGASAGNIITEQTRLLAEPPEQFRWSFMLNPDFKTDNNDELHFSSLLKAAYMAGDMTLVIEEVDNHCSWNYTPPALKIIVDYGRHRALDIVWLTRNLPDVSRKLTSQTDLWVLFRQQEPIYLKKLGERFGDDVVSAVSELEPFRYVILESKTGDWEERAL